jgi:hypothetical protein
MMDDALRVAITRAQDRAATRILIEDADYQNDPPIETTLGDFYEANDEQDVLPVDLGDDFEDRLLPRARSWSTLGRAVRSSSASRRRNGPSGPSSGTCPYPAN